MQLHILKSVLFHVYIHIMSFAIVLKSSNQIHTQCMKSFLALRMNVIGWKTYDSTYNIALIYNVCMQNICVSPTYIVNHFNC